MANNSFSGLQSALADSIGTIGLPGAFTGPSPSGGITTTAVNMVIVVNGLVQGFVRSFSIDEQFNSQRVKAIGGAVAAAIIPGVYEATGAISRSFLLGQSLESALGGGIRPVLGEYQASPDFTQFYFDILTLDPNGNVLDTFNDCVLMSLRRAVEIEGVIIMDDAQLAVRYRQG